MKFSDDLYQLISSLNQSEKRYIKLVAKAFTSKGTDNQLALFDAFDRQQQYNEDKIRKDFEDKIPAKNFHVAKNRLYNLILKALYLYHLKSSDYQKINQLIYQSEILQKKGLYKQADALNEKAVQTAVKMELFPLAITGLSTQARSFMNQRNLTKIKHYLDRNLEEEYQLLEQYKTDLTYQFLQLKTLFITHKQQVVRSEEEMAEIQQLKEHPLLKNSQLATSKNALDMYRFLNGFIYRYEGNYEQAAEYWQEFVDEIEGLKSIPKSKIEDYITDLNNLMFLQLEALLFDKAWGNCQKMVGLLSHERVKNNPHLIIKIKERVIEFKLEYYLLSYQYKAALHYQTTNNPEIVGIYDKVGDFRRLVIDYIRASIYLCNQMPKEAGHQIEQVFSNKVLKQHQYIYAGAMILNLLIHFELGNYQLLESLLLNTYRMMYKRKLLYKSEKIIFKYLKKYLRMLTNQEIMESFKSLKQELQAVRVDKFERNFLPNFDLVVWIESKIQEKSMSKIISDGGLTL
ncbi:hypothetical protein [Aureispira anguillae]|uniref:Uncharacterized protein n=1 Tax=Aureispira anguillae TaxID=2864201 RepID=A0A916DS45_9BACT|nr:hypothetical protein [Aureispira anguillae]BDS11646.1 hypothetical protein AsAng_0023600 [Aureispira anguillae]